jgi:hypothetical protein
VNGFEKHIFVRLDGKPLRRPWLRRRVAVTALVEKVGPDEVIVKLMPPVEWRRPDALHWRLLDRLLPTDRVRAVIFEDQAVLGEFPMRGTSEDNFRIGGVHAG